MLLFQNQPCCKQASECEYGVHVTNSYIHAKFEIVLLDIYRDSHHFINVIYYSRVDDEEAPNLHVLKT